MVENVFKDDLLEGKHAVITGGSRGLNFGIARRFAEKGAKLTLLARTEEDLGRSVAVLRDQCSAEAVSFAVDVRDSERLNTVLEDAVEDFGPIDVLVCGAAGNFPAAAGEMSAGAFGSVVDIDLKGTFNACRSAYEHFSRPGARIVAISAPQSDQPTPFQAHAGAAKAGVDSLVRTLAVEWGEEGIRVNAIQPGPVEGTEGVDRLVPDEDSQKRLKDVLPAGRFVEIEEVASLALYLVSPVADYITGAVIPIDGGQGLIGSGITIDALIPDENPS